jgi:hypothetical protein
MPKVFKKIGQLGMALAIIFMTTGVLIAGDTNPYEIKPITPPPLFDSSGEDASADVQNHYDIIGPLDAMHSQWMIVGDTEIKIAPNAIFYDVTPGNYVGIQLNDEGQAVEATNLHRKVRR